MIILQGADFLRVVVLAQAPRARAREAIRSMLMRPFTSMLLRGNLTSMLVGPPGACTWGLHEHLKKKIIIMTQI